jgi:hypothetical protein
MAVELNPLELKLLRLVLDASAHAGEAESGRQKLIASLAKRGLSHHDVIEALVEPDLRSLDLTLWLMNNEPLKEPISAWNSLTILHRCSMTPYRSAKYRL